MAKRSHRRRSNYSPEKTLMLTTLDPALEDVARDLYEKACCGSRHCWPDLQSASSLKDNPELRKRFFSSAHKGMRSAQSYIVQQIQRGSPLTPSEELLYRGIADSIAWQLLGCQLCYARRLYKEHRQPDLRNSNFESLVGAVEALSKNDNDIIALISDLTSFVQVGDILSFSPTYGLSIHEVKEGKVNQKIGQFLEFYAESGCDRALRYFVESEGPHTVKQMGRMIRQVERMQHVVQVMKSGSGVDPDTAQTVRIPEEYIHIDEWNDELANIIQKSDDNGWALDVIDDCLFVACYSSGPMLPASHLAFNTWFDGCGGDASSPRARLLDGMQAPLALPVFSRAIPDESKFDLLFGRKNICMGINVDSLMEKCRTSGLTIRFGSNRETSKTEQAGVKPFRHNGKSLFVGDGNKEMMLMGGIFMRVLFHCQKPISTIKSILSAEECT